MKIDNHAAAIVDGVLAGSTSNRGTMLGQSTLDRLRNGLTSSGKVIHVTTPD